MILRGHLLVAMPVRLILELFSMKGNRGEGGLTRVIYKDAKTGDSVRKWSDIGIDYVLDYARGFIEKTMNATTADEL